VIWNQAMVKMSGIRTYVAMGLRVERLPAPWGELLGHFLRVEETAANKLHRMVDGDSRWFNLHKARLDEIPSTRSENASRLQIGVVVLVEDLTETQLLEAELMHSERLASIGRFAAGVAHEIGNPVTGIACLAQNIRDESGDEDTRHAVKQILEQTKRISNIVKSLVGFSHGGQVDSEYGMLELSACISDAIELVRLSERAKHLGIDVSCESDIHVWGDRQRLLQVFVNVLINACDASQAEDNVMVTVEGSEAMVDILVEDTGSGIDGNDLERVFDPFFTTKEPGVGTGLGLALCYNIVREHGGQISVRSTHGEGTTVLIRLQGSEPNEQPRIAEVT
jgi:signal transduction histidine kinase